MRYRALALDFDGTLATDGCVDDSTVSALERARASGRKLVMVTGRELPSLHATFARADIFDLIVAENGGLLYEPGTGTQTMLAEAPPFELFRVLKARGVRVSMGAVVVATWEEHHAAVVDLLVELGMTKDVDLILNKGAVMILPRNVNKGTGIACASTALAIPLTAFVGIGDAENDAPLLHACGVGVAVENALDAIKAQADIVTRGARGAGVVEIVESLLVDDLDSYEPRPRR